MKINLLPVGYKSHINAAIASWKGVVKCGDVVIDATCGNGHDSLTLAKLALKQTNSFSTEPSSSLSSNLLYSGKLFCFDIQEKAILSTRKRLEENGFTSDVFYFCQSHETFPSIIPTYSVSCVTYNLGYLPSSEKTLITKTESTIKSLELATKLICRGGLISVLAYPRHEGGFEESESVKEFINNLSSEKWEKNMYHYENLPLNPFLLTAKSLL